VIVNVVVSPENRRKILDVPDDTVVPPDEMVPPIPAVALIWKLACAKLTAMVCVAVTLLNKYEVGKPTSAPSTVTADILYPELGVNVKFVLEPWVTICGVEGLIAPFAPAEGVMV